MPRKLHSNSASIIADNGLVKAIMDKSENRMNNEELQKKINRIREHVLKTGFPSEIEVGNTLRRNGWIAGNQYPYTDKESGKLRAVDVYALKLGSSLPTWGVALLIECKKSEEHEWVFYTQKKEGDFLPGLWTLGDFFTKLGESSISNRYVELMKETRTYSFLGARYPAEKRRELLAKVSGIHVLDKAIRMGVLCKVISLKSKVKDDFHVATQQVLSALQGMSESVKSFMVFPVIVFDGEMFEFFQEGDDWPVLPIDHLQFTSFQKAEIGRLPCLIDVVRKTYFPEYLKIIERDFSILDEFMKPVNDGSQKLPN